MDFDDDYVVKDKVVKIYRNGDPMSKPVEVKVHRGLSLAKLQQLIEMKMEFKNVQRFRLFNQEGVELYEDDLQYLKDKAVIYASKGEEFDANSTFSEFNLIRVLGEGGFGQVLLGEHKTTKEKSAIKIVKTNVIGNAQDIDMVFREAEILKSLNHKNIVKIKNCYSLSDMKVVFIMEYLEGGELLDRVEKANQLSEEQAKIYFKQIVEAMAYCHKNKLIHRDLKLENILLLSKTSDEVKIVDFGIAGVASKYNVENIDAGSLRYMAPEVLNGKTKQLTPAIDVWAMGIILYMMLVGDFPFNSNQNSVIVDKITEGAYEIPKAIKQKLSKECIDAITKTLQVDPANRISTGDLLNHPFISQQDITIKFLEEEDLKQQQEAAAIAAAAAAQKEKSMFSSSSSTIGNKNPLSRMGSSSSQATLSTKINGIDLKKVKPIPTSMLSGRSSVMTMSSSDSHSNLKLADKKKPTILSTNVKGSFTPQAKPVVSSPSTNTPSSVGSIGVKRMSESKSGFSGAMSSSRLAKK